MKTLALALTLALLVSAPLAHAASEGDNLDRFFHSFAGRWHGEGKADDVGGYHFDLEVTESAPSTWTACNTLRTDSGDYRQSSISFEVVSSGTGEDRVNGLYISSSPYGAWEPVSLVETSPRSLTYFIRRADFASGRVYDLFYSLSLDASGQAFTGLNTVKLNDVINWRENLTGQRD